MNTYHITGKRWSMEKHWYTWDDEHRFPTFETIGEKTFTVKAKSITHAYLWMILFHPFYAVGCGVTCEENNDFIFDAVFDYYYSLGFRNVLSVNFHNFKEANRIIFKDWVSAIKKNKVRS